MSLFVYIVTVHWDCCCYGALSLGGTGMEGRGVSSVYAVIEECLLSFETLQGGLENVFVF